MINYIVHDVNASSDSKIKRLKMKHKNNGYGVYWSILEQIGLTNDGMLEADFNLLGYELRESADLVKSVVCDFGLFEFTEDKKYFFSKRLLESIEEIHAKSEKCRLAGVKSGETRRKSNERLTNVEQSFNECSTDVEQSKEKKSKVENSNNITISVKNDGEETIKQPLLLPSSFDKDNNVSSKNNKTFKEEQKEIVSDFEDWWNEYPKKKSKKDALKAYLKARKKANKEQLEDALKEVKEKDWKYKDEQYIPHASTWLNQERWNDVIQINASKSAKKADFESYDYSKNPLDF